MQGCECPLFSPHSFRLVIPSTSLKKKLFEIKKFDALSRCFFFFIRVSVNLRKYPALLMGLSAVIVLL